MIPILTALMYALFGLIIGSFLNVVILRHGARTVGGRSGCLSCRSPLLWYDMLPVVSWIILRGRCRACGSRISVQYPLVEASTAVLFALVGLSMISLPLKIASLIIIALLVLIATYDIRHTIIPDGWAYAFAAVAFLSSLSFALGQGMSGILLALVAGPVSALPLFVLWLVSRGSWMGLGDAKLALGIGWLLGLEVGITAIFFAFVIGAVVSVSLLMLQRLREKLGQKVGITRLVSMHGGLTMKSEVPFGPFLIASCLFLWLMMMYGISLPSPFFFQ